MNGYTGGPARDIKYGEKKRIGEEQLKNEKNAERKSKLWTFFGSVLTKLDDESTPFKYEQVVLRLPSLPMYFTRTSSWQLYPGSTKEGLKME